MLVFRGCMSLGPNIPSWIHPRFSPKTSPLRNSLTLRPHFLNLGNHFCRWNPLYWMLQEVGKRLGINGLYRNGIYHISIIYNPLTNLFTNFLEHLSLSKNLHFHRWNTVSEIISQLPKKHPIMNHHRLPPRTSGDPITSGRGKYGDVPWRRRISWKVHICGTCESWRLEIGCTSSSPNYGESQPTTPQTYHPPRK